MVPEPAAADRTLCADHGLGPAAGEGERHSGNVVMAQPVPVTLLTGFLGSGKTTLLRRLLMRPELADSAVIINEAGEVPIDHHLLQFCREDIAVLPNGCLCCTVRSDLVDAMRNLLFNRGRPGMPAYRRVFIETTGLADPVPVLQALSRDPFVRRLFRLDGIVTTVDTTHAYQQLDRHRESVKQVAVADRLILTKTDLASDEQRRALGERLCRINPAASQHAAVLGEIDPAALLGICPGADDNPQHFRRWMAADRYRPVARTRWLGVPARAETHDAGIRACVIRCDKPLSAAHVETAIHMLCGLIGENLLRLKALLDIEGRAAPVVMHAVQHVVYPPVMLEAWPDGDRRSVFVLIARDLEPAYFRELLGRALGEGVFAAENPDAPPVYAGENP
jgi:G3E family GTPase